jgi:hypothetical protein
MSNLKSIRYYIEKDFTIADCEDFKNTSKIYVKDKVFISILENINNLIYKIKIYLEDGTVIEDVYFLNISDDIKLYNKKLLFDGRFNT